MQRSTKTFEESYKSWRNKARRFNADLLLSAILSEMQGLPSQGENLVRAAPWQLLLMAKWICQDEHAHNTGGRELTNYSFLELRNEIWNFETAFPDSGIELLMRRLFRPQIAFQIGPSVDFLRDLTLISESVGVSQTRQIFENQAGVQVEAFIDLSIALTAMIVSGKKTIRPGDLASFINHHGVKIIENYFRCISATWAELKTFCRALPDAKKKVASELYELPVLTRYPLVRFDYGFRSWHPMCFYRGMDEIFHHVMKPSGENYMEQFGKLFERQAVNRFVLDGYRSLSGSELEEVSGGQEFCDGALISESCQLFIEVKASIFSEDVLVAGNKEYFARNTKQLLKAINQGISTVKAVRATELTSSEVPTYMLIVINKRIGLVDARRYVSMLPDSYLEKCHSDAQLPTENIFFMHIDEYEVLMDWFKDGFINPKEFFSKCVEDGRSPQTSVYEFSQLMERHGGEIKMPRAIEEMYEKALSRMKNYLH